MNRWLPFWLQTCLIVAVFIGSLSVLLVTAYASLLQPDQEERARSELGEANRRMTAAAENEVSGWTGGPLSPSLAEKLRSVSDRVLAHHAGVEGGFYLDDRFVAYSFPTGSPRLQRDDPPPLEASLIRDQARRSLSLEPGDFLLTIQDVGPSRVAVLTQPVGSSRPARLAAWTMFRLTSPEKAESRAQRYLVSAGLALGGVALSLTLMVNLGRTLRRQRREKEQLTEELRRAEHLAALGKLLAGVAHEVRNPLAGIRSTVQLWQRMPETARSQPSLEAVVQAVDRLNEIVTRLLCFSRSEQSERHPVNVNQVLAEAVELITAQAALQGVTLERDLATDLPTVSGSAAALRQVFLNLATNGLHAMSKGGCLRVTTRHDRATQTVQVRIADSGSGISPDDRKHLFEPFFTTRPDGTGLGLALCREIILSHGGQIELEPEAKPGATFCVRLPVS